MSKATKEVSVDLDSILKELGSFGRYQVLTYCLILLPIMISAVHNGQYVFNAAAVPYRCVVPECESPPYHVAAGAWSSFALDAQSQCVRPAPAGDCRPERFGNGSVDCTQWVYDDGNSIVAEFDLACEEWKRTLVGTVHSLGLFAALPLTAFISDNFGRRVAIIATMLCGSAVGFVRSFSSGYVMYLVLEFLEPTLGSGVYSTGFILALEMVGSKRRVLGGNLISTSYALGQVLLGLTAWGVPYWRSLTRVLYAPGAIGIIYIFLIEESVRWLLSKGKKEEAARIIFKAAAINKKKLSPEAIKQLSSDNIPESEKKIEEEKAPSLTSQVFKSKIILTRLAICSFWWITLTFIYYGLSINSVSLAGSKYVNYMLTSLVEIPGYFLSTVTLDRFGRKSSIMTAYFICGVSLVVLPFIPTSIQWLATTLTMVGKLSISMCFSSIYIYTSELFPTRARHSLLGFCSFVGRIGSIVAPQTPLLMNVLPSLPYLIFGVMAVTSGFLMLLTPETLHTDLPDTIEQAENISKSQDSS